MLHYLFDIFRTGTKNQCVDLTIATAMFLADARFGRQQYGPDGLDYAGLHRDYEALAEQEKDLLRFIARHYPKLVDAYRTGDRETFDGAVALGVEEDERSGEDCGGDGRPPEV